MRAPDVPDEVLALAEDAPAGAGVASVAFAVSAFCAADEGALAVPAVVFAAFTAEAALFSPAVWAAGVVAVEPAFDGPLVRPVPVAPPMGEEGFALLAAEAGASPARGVFAMGV